MRVVIVQPDARLLSVCCTALEARGHRVVPSRSGHTAWQALAEGRVDCILMDFALPKNNAVKLLKRVGKRKGRAGLPLALMVGQVERDLARLNELGVAADVLLAKPFGTQEVLQAMEHLQRNSARPITIRRLGRPTLPR